jgi:hypothetical protein
VIPAPLVYFFPERREPFVRLLERHLFHEKHRGDGEEEEVGAIADDAPLDLRIPRGRGYGGPPPTGVKLWQLLGLLFALFAAHYTLVQKTISDANKDLKYELLIAQQNISATIAEEGRRIAAIEANDRELRERINAHELEDKDTTRRVTLIEERQRQVMTKLGMAR